MAIAFSIESARTALGRLVPARFNHMMVANNVVTPRNPGNPYASVDQDDG
ncbi:hypothetical protein ANO14919_138400 [Xylariales sp. No.14919]|nr:hypothetical protein ANO14919_138400 [Xylariales sp. No.14919]